MTKKHFIVIARLLNDLWAEIEPNSKQDRVFNEMLDEMIVEFRKANPLFDSEKFRKAVITE